MGGNSMLVLQKLTVKDAYHLDLRPSLIVGSDDNFSDVVQRFASQPDARGIFVADSDKHLLGVITRTDLLDWAKLRLGAFLHISQADRNKSFRFISLMHASTAGEVMHPDSRKAAVKADDSLAHALRLMLELDLIVLPVVDDSNRIVEDLKLDEILGRIVEEESHSNVSKNE
jgi:CBS-domain-containing membrane protein